MDIEKSKVINIIKNNLSVNYNTLKNEREDEILEEIFDAMCLVALSISHQKKIDNLIPYIKTAVKSEYLRRGKEGEKSNREGSQNAEYEEIIKKLEQDIISSGNRRFK